MSFWCNKGDNRHQHSTVQEARECTGLPVAAKPCMSTLIHESHGACPGYPLDSSGSKDQASGGSTTLPASPPRPPQPPVTASSGPFLTAPAGVVTIPKTEDPPYAVDGYRRRFTDERLKLIGGMMDLIPDGYYATQANDTDTVDFIRLSRPNRGDYKDHVKFQTQHSENWIVRASIMPDGVWQVLDRSIIPMLMLLVVDHRTCARRYAIEIQSCCVCNTTLTDDRSRHYLIGPICDKKPQWLWVIDDVDDKNDGLSYEALVARGMPTRVWQDQYR